MAATVAIGIQNFDKLREENYRALQGTYPVIFLSFSRIKEKSVDWIDKV